ncbi:uncharacterized protein LOC118825699 [Colossoma macropomum]|uniref:uncharacterized protein LOC118825699 n=1 Tax=Colossoma macropomum TaxID=42526 RepID=UPI0018648925|nr:uncharacterized protein LOC118825699 [Colossoma macropomum]XP_036452372.1 uncharacterized protein LOC118825699 [Colossoma macropomum]XP_036452380.1 uncharacterized protein LOC118825699 [Colossoma macropomum]XP_036452389.1 uncharacterized protein LOC118825699 [Colossoma macropomum]
MFLILFTPGLFSLCLGSEPLQYHFIADRKNWTEAQRYCREVYSDLATITNADVMSGLLRNISAVSTENVYIGLHRTDIYTWHWSLPDISPQSDFRNWKRGQPNVNSNQDRCAVMEPSGEWVEDSCSTQRQFVCIDEIGGGYVLVEVNRSWREAQEHCRTFYTDLASARNSSENQAVNVASKFQQVWIGLFKDSWVWSDQSDSSYRFWKTNQPNNLKGQDCTVATMNRTGRWNDVSCGNANAFICQEALKMQNTPSQSVTSPASRPIQNQISPTAATSPNVQNISLNVSPTLMKPDTTAASEMNQTATQHRSRFPETDITLSAGYIPSPTAQSQVPTDQMTTSNGSDTPDGAVDSTGSEPGVTAHTTLLNTATESPQASVITSPESTITTTPLHVYTQVPAAKIMDGFSNIITPSAPSINSTPAQTLPTAPLRTSKPAAETNTAFSASQNVKAPLEPTVEPTAGPTVSRNDAQTQGSNVAPKHTRRSAEFSNETTMALNTETILPQTTVTVRDTTTERSIARIQQQLEDNLVLVKENLTWSEAVRYCREHHVDLMSVLSEQQQKSVEKKASLASSSYVWLGLRYSCTFNFWFWIRNRETGCYQNWAPGHRTEGLDCGLAGAMESGGEHRWAGRSQSDRFNFVCFTCATCQTCGAGVVP